MSGILLAAEEAYRRYVTQNEGVVPPVRVFHALGETTFNGIRVQPTTTQGVVAFGPADVALPVLVLREVDIHQVLIGDVTPRFGYQR